jgi:hypothetical protein
VAGRLGVYIYLLLEARSTVGRPKLASERSMKPMVLLFTRIGVPPYLFGSLCLAPSSVFYLDFSGLGFSAG